MLRNVVVGLVLLATLAGGVPAVAASSSRAADEAAVERATYKLFRLQIKGLFDVLYDRLHPDARAAVPEAVLVAWHETEAANKRTNDLVIEEIAFGEWTWEGTGETYEAAATVSFVHAYWADGQSVEEPGTLHFARDGEEWGWFFGESRAFVDEQVARFADLDPSTFSPFANPLDADVDLYWARTFAAAERDYEHPKGIVGFDAPIDTVCGLADPWASPAFYCPLDETIYYVIGFRQEMTAEMGDFGWVSIIAHEWGHHVQDSLGLRGLERSEETGALTYKAAELQADCLAGAYSRDAQERGWLDPGDLDEAEALFAYAGDPPGTPQDHLHAHGTAEERVAAFNRGFNRGYKACGLKL
jgi:predicted metalloprotease